MSRSSQGLSWRVWVESCRPNTLLLAVASVMTGSALAFSSGSFNMVVSVLCLLTALLLQIVSNLANDYGDFVKGTDTGEAGRIGPIRSVHKGLISLPQLRGMLFGAVAMAAFCGMLLVLYATRDLVVVVTLLGLGGVSIVAAITYTVGRKPYGYIGLGDVSVLIFFGWLGVAGSYYLQTGLLDWRIFLPATGCGLLAVAVLNVNNLRDIEGDQLAGKNTLVVRMGFHFGQGYQFCLMLLALLTFIVYAVLGGRGPGFFLFLLALPWMLGHVVHVGRAKGPAEIEPLMGEMVRLALLMGFLFSLGLCLQPTLP